jgi:uncharacterized repeat protein (TIGR01451 family)
MAIICDAFRAAVILCVAPFLITSSFSQPEQVFDLQLGSLAVDSRSGLLYGGQTNQLLQINPENGQVLRTFDVGAPIKRLVRGGGSSLWIGQDYAVRRFDLDTLAVAETIEYPGALMDLAPSMTDPRIAAVKTPHILGRYATTWIIRNGVLLPKSLGNSGETGIGISGSFLFGLYRYTFGPDGIIDSSGGLLFHGPRYHALGTHIYTAGSGFDVVTLQGLPVAVPDGIMAVNREENDLYILGYRTTGATLDRYEPITLERTGHYILPVLNPLEDTLVAWSSNRAAFATATNLYVLDTEEVFARPEVEVTQTVSPDPAIFGDAITFTITLTNRGKGAALNVELTNSISASVPLGTFEPGAMFQHAIRIVASNANITVGNVAGVVLDDDSNPENNSVTNVVRIGASTGRVTPVAVAASDLYYHKVTGKLYRVSGQTIDVIDPDGQRIIPSITLPEGFPGARMEGGTSADYLLVQGPRVGPGGLKLIARVHFNGTATPLFGVGSAIIDFAVSPADNGMIAVSDTTGTYLTRPGGILPERLPRIGQVEFSEDGTKLYFLDINSCNLEVFLVTSAGLRLEQERVNVDCSDLSVMNGQIFFDSGLIYDPVNFQASTNSLILAEGSLVLPRPDGRSDVLTKTNEQWVLRRLTAGGREPEMSVPVPQLSGTPLELVEAGADYVAIRTRAAAGGETGARDVFVVNLADTSTLSLRIQRNNPQLALSFFGAAGKSYRIEQNSGLSALEWTLLRDNLPGNDGFVNEVLAAGERVRFFRVIEVR